MEVVDEVVLDMHNTKTTKIENLCQLKAKQQNQKYTCFHLLYFWCMSYVVISSFFKRSFLMSPYCQRVLGGF